jgi:beta-glucanase (GH16 family)
MNTSTTCSNTSFLLLFLFLFSACNKGSLSNENNELATSARAAAPIEAASTTVNATAICDYVFNETTLTNTGWAKTFEDNFDTDLSKWNIWTGGAFNNELQHYQAANLQIANGILAITAKKETVTGATTPYDATPKTFQYTSGRIECKTNVSASTATPKVRMVARIKLAPGYGMWPAFWSYGDRWPTQGEIDFVEARGQEPTKYQTNYFYGRTANRNLVRNAEGFIITNADLTTCYHVYEMQWEQNTLTSFLDGNQVEVKSGGYVPNLFGKTEHIALNLAVGGLFFTNLDPAQISPGSMYVDYVKVFTSN